MLLLLAPATAACCDMRASRLVLSALLPLRPTSLTAIQDEFAKAE